MAGSWLVEDRRAAATERILDAAGRCFAERGLTTTTIGDIAAAAGCSRPTVYRYFPDRDALRTAFVHREAQRIGREAAAAADAETDAGSRLVTAVLAALAAVRRDEVLAPWFTAAASGTTERIANASEVIAALVAPFVDAGDDVTTRDRAEWVVRVVVSLLVTPAATPSRERALLERFVVPVVVGPG